MMSTEKLQAEFPMAVLWLNIWECFQEAGNACVADEPLISINATGSWAGAHQRFCALLNPDVQVQAFLV